MDLGMFSVSLAVSRALTLNPPHVRGIQKTEEEGEGPGHAVLQDRDGNTILLDQF